MSCPETLMVWFVTISSVLQMGLKTASGLVRGGDSTWDDIQLGESKLREGQDDFGGGEMPMFALLASKSMV